MTMAPFAPLRKLFSWASPCNSDGLYEPLDLRGHVARQVTGVDRRAEAREHSALGVEIGPRPEVIGRLSCGRGPK